MKYIFIQVLIGSISAIQLKEHFATGLTGLEPLGEEIAIKSSVFADAGELSDEMKRWTELPTCGNPGAAGANQVKLADDLSNATWAVHEHQKSTQQTQS